MRIYLIINQFIDKSIIFIKRRRAYFLILFLLVFFAPLFILAQTVYFDPQSIGVEKNTNFSLPLKINSVNNLFAVNFDLDFDPSLVEYLGTTQGNFLSQGCSTALMVSPSSPGKIIFGLTRLGASCGGVSGSGLIATLNFKSLEKEGTGTLSFSNNNLCILSGSNCNYVVSTWLPATVTVETTPPSDTTPPVRSNGSPSGILSAGVTQTALFLTTNETAACRYSISAGIAYASMSNTFSTTGDISHSTTLIGLANGTSYTRYVRCQDSAGNANFDDYVISFSVASDNVPPVISSINISLITADSATISWTTNKPADSRVEYGLSSSYGNQTNLDSSLTAIHSIIINGLSAGTLYHFRVRSKDSNANLAISGDYTFSTLSVQSFCPGGLPGGR